MTNKEQVMELIKFLNSNIKNLRTPAVSYGESDEDTSLVVFDNGVDHLVFDIINGKTEGFYFNRKDETMWEDEDIFPNHEFVISDVLRKYLEIFIE